MSVTTNNFFKTKVLGHPAGLFVLFFTEMWERFSFYGMRVLLINFLTMAAIGTNPGWEWSTNHAGALFGTYAMLLYLTPIAGGIIADKVLGYRWAVVVGAVIMTLGHISMAIETEFSLYLGLVLLIIGTGFFKPNMTSIISEMYKDLPEKKDGAYTIFYMGVNAGAFFGMMLCGYLAEKVGWSWGFGLAGIFMLLGTLQFWLAKPLFGKIGEIPQKTNRKNEKILESDNNKTVENHEETKKNPFTLMDKILIIITSFIGLGYAINDPLSKIGDIHIFPEEFIVSKDILSGPLVLAIIGLVLFIILIISRVSRYNKIIRDRMIAVIIFALFTIFFFASFEQGATSLVLFARDFTDRTMEGNSANIYLIVNTLLTIIPLAIVSWVLILLFKQTRHKILSSNIVLASSFLIIWGIVIWMLNNDISSHAYEIEYKVLKIPKIDEKTKKQEVDKEGNLLFQYIPITESYVNKPLDKIETLKTTIASKNNLKIGDEIAIHGEIGVMVPLSNEQEKKIREDYISSKKDSGIIHAKVSELRDSKIEITTSWFSILNSFFIIAFASLFTKWWDSKYNPSAAVKYGLGLIIMAIGFGVLAFGSQTIPQGATAGMVRVSIVWLILAYLFHTLGELCLSPVGLSYVSKLVPGRMIAFMFGMWYLAIAIGNKLAASMGGMIEEIAKKSNMTNFFLIFTIIPIIAGIIVILLNPLLKKLMHGVK